MCKAIEYSNELIKLIDTINQDYDCLVKENSKTDLMITDVMHKIEFDNFNAAEGYRLAKQLKDIRIERRKYKDEAEAMQSLVCSLKPIVKNIQDANKNVENVAKKQMNRTYKPRIFKDNVVSM